MNFHHYMQYCNGLTWNIAGNFLMSKQTVWSMCFALCLQLTFRLYLCQKTAGTFMYWVGMQWYTILASLCFDWMRTEMEIETAWHTSRWNIIFGMEGPLFYSSEFDWLMKSACAKTNMESRCETAGTVTGKSHGCPYSVWDLANNKGLFGALLGGNLAWITTYPAISIAYVPLSKDSQSHSSWWVDLIRSCKCALF